MHFLGDIIRRICRKYGTSRLEDCVPFIIMLINIMYSDAAFFFTGSDYRFVNTVAIHPLSSVFRQKSRMYIYYFIGISMQKQIGHTNQKACQHDKINAGLLQNSQNFVSGYPIFLWKHVTGHSQAMRTF